MPYDLQSVGREDCDYRPGMSVEVALLQVKTYWTYSSVQYVTKCTEIKKIKHSVSRSCFVIITS